MTKTTLFALLMLTTLPSPSRADEFDDRANEASRRVYQAALAKDWRLIHLRNAARLQRVHQFTQSHSGLVSGQCVWARIQFTNALEDSWMSISNGYADIASLDPAGPYAIESCRVKLRNGMDCDITSAKNNDAEGTYNINVDDVTCYDARAVKHEYKIGSAAPKTR